MPRLVAPGRDGRRRTGGRNTLDVFVIWPSPVLDVAHLGNFAPGHGGHLCVQIDNELADLRWERLARFSGSALLPGGEEALHPVSFKLIGFAGQRSAGDIDVFGSLPCGFMEQDERSKSRSGNPSTHNVNNELGMNLVVLRENTYPHRFFDERNVDHEGTTSTPSPYRSSSLDRA